MPAFISHYDMAFIIKLSENFMKILSTVILASTLMASGVAMADVAAGKAAYAGKGCIGCHGAGGVSAIPTYPSLKGKDAAFMSKSLTDFKSGARKNPTMNAMTAGLTDADITNIAAYIGSL